MPRSDRAWVSQLTAAEQQALSESEAFFLKQEGRLQKMMSRLGKPLDRLLGASPKSFQQALTKSLHGVLTTMADSGHAGASYQKLHDEICLLAKREIDPWDRLFEIDFEQLQPVAKRHLKQAKNLATVQGGVTGLGGLPGILADIPSLYFLVFRMSHQVAYTLGFPAESAAEKMYLLQVVNVGHHLEARDRRCALLELDELEAQLSRKSSTEDLQRTMLAKSIQLLARKLASNLIHRKAAQSVALVGGAVGAVLNRQLADDVGQAAFHAYRRRFLKRVAITRMT